MIKNRYFGCKMIIFGDFNISKKKFNVQIENILGNEFKYHYNINTNSFTRTRKINNDII